MCGRVIKTLWGFVLSSCHCDPRQSTTHTPVLLLYVLTLKPHPYPHCINPTMCGGPLLPPHKACRGRDRVGNTQTTLITHRNVTHSMTPSPDPPPPCHIRTHTCPHLLIRHGELVSPVNQRAGGGGSSAWEQGGGGAVVGGGNGGFSIGIKGGCSI